MLNGKEIQVGTSYKTRSGETVTITSYTNHAVYPWEEDEGKCWTENGEYFVGEASHADLIHEVNHENLDQANDYNVVTKPKHYQLIPEKNIEVKHIVAVLADRLGTNGYNGAFIGDYVQLLQYLMRFDEKNGKEDLEKAQWFLNGMIENHPDVQQLKGQK